MKNRLLNLFTQKRNSAVLVCLVAVAALLAGGLVACEKASGSEGTLSPENEARRRLFQTYFDENYREENTSVVLADVTGDGLEELLVLSLDPDAEDPPSLRGELVRFSYGRIEYFGVEDGAVVKYPGTSDISDSHAGWGFVYLVPQETGYAIAHFTPYIGQGSASYAYGVYTLDMDEGFVTVEQDEVFFQLERDSAMGGDTGSDSPAAEVEAFLERWYALRDSGVPLLVYYDDTAVERSYLSVPPAEAFGGKAEMTLPALREYVVTNGMEAGFPLPEAWPETPEQALDWLESSLSAYSDGYVFRVPNYGGTWDIYISGRMRVDSLPYGQYVEVPQFMSVHYLEDETWVPGRRYAIETGEAELENLTMYVTVIAPDGSGHTARYLTLKENGENVWNQPADIAAPPENVAAAYLETMARRMYLYEEGSGLDYTAYYGGRTMVVSYIPPRNYELLDGRVLSQTEVQSRLSHMEDAVNCLKYQWMAADVRREDVSIGYTVEQVEVDGNYAAVDIWEQVDFRYRELTEPSSMGSEYRVDLARLDGNWLVVDVNQPTHIECVEIPWEGGLAYAMMNMSDPLWCDSKDEESFSTFAGLPHDLDWFSSYINDHRTRPDWANFLTGEDRSALPVSCVAGWFDSREESGETCWKLLYSPVAADDYLVTVRLEDDDSLTLLDAVKIPRENG